MCTRHLSSGIDSAIETPVTSLWALYMYDPSNSLRTYYALVSRETREANEVLKAWLFGSDRSRLFPMARWGICITSPALQKIGVCTLWESRHELDRALVTLLPTVPLPFLF